MSTQERRAESRARQSWQPHPDQIRECAGVAEFYGADFGPLGEDVIRRVLVAAAAWQETQDSQERQHARLRDQGAVAARVALHLASSEDERRRVSLVRPLPKTEWHVCAECGGAKGRDCADCLGAGVL